MSGVTLNAPNPAAIHANTNTTGAVELTESGGRALKLQTDTPHLVSLGGGRLSTAVTIHPIQQGRTTLGSGPGVDITIQGTGVEPLHCQIENSSGIVTIYPISENVSIDGIPVIHPTRLSQGVMLTIGRSNYMRFNHPAEAQLMKSVLPNSRISMAPITFDTSEDELKFLKKPPIPRKNQREYINDDEETPSNIQMKVSKFEYLAAQNFKKSISPKVFSSNLVTVNTPAKDVLGRAPPDLQDFAKNLPQPACNYLDSINYTDKQKNNKMSDRYMFGRKSPQYVNIAVNNEPKNINNKVAIYENGCIPKQHNVYLNINADQQPKNELNNMNNKCMNNKTVNVNRVNAPSPSYNRNPSPSFNRNPPAYFKCAAPIHFGNSYELDTADIRNCSDSGFEDTGCMKNDTEIRRNQAYAERVKEQEIEQAEQARLEEILNMCAEYERQVQWERANKPPTPNRIITNGLLPREKRHRLSSSPFNTTPSPNHTSLSNSHDGSVFRFDADVVSQNNSSRSNYNYENVSVNHTPICRDTSSRYYYENVELKPSEMPVTNSYENAQLVNSNQSNGHIQGQYFPPSPRTRIKTIPTCNKDKDSSSKDSAQLIEKKFAMLTTEQLLLQNQCLEDSKSEKTTLSKTFTCNKNEDKAIYFTLKKEKRELLAAVASTKRKMTEIQMQEEELNRELEMERALIIGEYKAKLQELSHLENCKENLVIKAHEIEHKMEDCQVTQAQHQENCKQKLELAQESVDQIQTKLSLATKGSVEYQQLFEDFLTAQETLDNERKTFEDLEFHHLEEEADWLVSREEIQREIVDLTKRIDVITIQVNELEQQKLDTSHSNAQESRTLERQLLKYLKQLEEYRVKLSTIDSELQMFVKQESDQEISSDSDSDKRVQNMSYSFIVQSSEPKLNDDVFNMSQSFNEKMLQEKTILEDSIGNRCPSQDDIDRISKVTSSAPLNIQDGQTLLGRKTIESLKEIERNRQLHLVQQGSQVIEEERKRVLELKQKAQTEVREQWAQRQIDSPYITSIISEVAHNNITGTEELDHKLIEPNNTETHRKIYSEPEGPESPRPLSETSDISVEVGGTLGRRRRQLIDKTRPLTRYLPIRSAELDLRQHIETAGHQVVLCPHVIINSVSCRGFLHKRGSKLNSWSRRWFVFDRNKRTLVYYSDKNEKKIRGGAYFQAIEEVYLDHSNSVKSPNANLTFIIKTHQRYYYLMAPSPEAMRIWIDVVFTGAEGYQEFEHGS